MMVVVVLFTADCRSYLLLLPLPSLLLSLLLLPLLLFLSTVVMRGIYFSSAALSSSVGLKPKRSSARSDSCRPMAPQTSRPRPTPMRAFGDKLRKDLM
ncbi:hypothetical protein F5Y13DRAFT_48556 [Hypoxylon sp. FL1857]|nr:hypothetical protein F5Y13DRAFT_48556 [Hypoxylon sp. FL1857]